MREDQALILETMRRKAEGEKVFPEFAEFLSRHDPRLRRRALLALKEIILQMIHEQFPTIEYALAF